MRSDDVIEEEYAGSVFLRNVQSCRDKTVISKEDSLRNDSLALYTPRLSKISIYKETFIETSTEGKLLLKDKGDCS